MIKGDLIAISNLVSKNKDTSFTYQHETISDKWSDITDSEISTTDINPEDLKDRSSNYFKTFVNVMKMYVGVVFISTSGCISQVGITTSVFGMVFVTALNVYCVYILLKARNRFKHHKIVDICDLAVMLYGERSRIWMQVVLFMSNMMYLIFYQIFFGTQIDQLVCQTFRLYDCGNKEVYIILINICLLPFIFMR